MTEPTPRIICLTIPTPIPIGPVNVYLIEREPLTLVDAGPKTEDAWAALNAGLATHGYRLSDIQRIVLTHAHVDHYGLLNRVVAASRAPVYAHPLSLRWLADTPGEWRRRAGFYVQVFAQSGVPSEFLEMLAQLAQLGVRLADSLPSTAEVHALDEGDQIRMGDRVWDVLYTPGHAASHISLYEPRSRQMLTGDHLLLKISSNPTLEAPLPGSEQRRRSLEDYIASYQRVAAMDIAIAWPGHGPPIEDHRTLIAQRLAHHRQRAETIAGLLADGPKTAYLLCTLLFPNLPPGQLFLGLSEVIGHLDVLETEGRVRVIADGSGVIWYEATQKGN